MENYYKVGGALRYNHPSYVIRQADRQLLQYLKAGEYCFVLSSRQMGKSSLRVRISRQLRDAEMQYAAVDLTLMGSDVTAQQWYEGFIYQVLNGLELASQPELETWWQRHQALSTIQRLEQLFATVLLQQLPQRLVIFIDEIDSIIKIPFKDDFFAFIRACYNLRAENPIFERLSFCLLGVATPNDLIQDKVCTPFNIGRSIELAGLTFAEASAALTPGLQAAVADPEITLKAILHWTGGQPFLTQKLCRLVVEQAVEGEVDVCAIAKRSLIDNWESQDEPEHLRTIRDRLLFDEKKQVAVLGLYQQILTTQEHELGIIADGSEEEALLKLSGLVTKQGRYLRVSNPIYQSVFDLTWVQSQLAQRRPYSETLRAWVESQRERSQLLEGQTLHDALAWAQEHTLSAIDREFLSESRAEQDRKSNQILAEAKCEAEQRLNLALEAERHLRRRSTLITGATSALALAIAIGTSFFVAHQLNFTKEVIFLERAGAEAEKQPNQLNALRQATEMVQRLQKLVGNRASLVNYPTTRPVSALLKTLSQIREYNQLTGHQGIIRTLSYSPDGQTLVSGSDDKTIRLWHSNGKFIRSIQLSGSVNSVSYSPTGKFFVTASGDGLIQIWQPDGSILRRFQPQTSQIFSVSVSPDGKWIVAGHEDGRITLWQADGVFLKTIQSDRNAVYVVSFSPDGKIIASGDSTGIIRLWHSDKTPSKAFTAHNGSVNSLAFSPDSKQIVSASADNTLRLWTSNGNPIKTLTDFSDEVRSVSFSPNGEMIVTGSQDHSLQIGDWHRDNKLKLALSGNSALSQCGLQPRWKNHCLWKQQ